MEKVWKRFDEELKNAKANRTSIRKKIDTANRKWIYTYKPLQLKIYTVFNKYGITPQAYHGGDFVVNRVKTFLQFSVKISSECTEFIKELPDENQRPNGEHRNMSNEYIDSKMKMLKYIILLSYIIYRMCHKPCGTMTGVNLSHVV